MKKFSILVVALAAMAIAATAQTSAQTQSQTNANVSGSANVNADKGNANAQTNTSASGSQDTNAAAQQSGARKRRGDRDVRSSGKASGNASQSTNAGTSGASGDLAAGQTLNAVLTKPVDSRKAKEGDEVTAKTTGTLKGAGERTIPKGTKLIGHVTKATARAKGDSQSELAIVFDRAELAKGREIPVHAVVQALASAQSTASANMAGMDDEAPMGGSMAAPAPQGSSGGGGLVGGVTHAAGSTVGAAGSAVGNTAGAVGSTAGQVGSSAGSTVGGAAGTATNTGANATGSLNGTAQGVVGFPGYTLDAATATATQGSVITSSGKNVKLDSGTHMVLRVVSE